MPIPVLALALSLLCLPLSNPLMELVTGESRHSTLLALLAGWALSLLPLYFVPWLRHRHFSRWPLVALLLPCAAALAASLIPAYWLQPTAPTGFSSVEYIIANSQTEQWRHLLTLALIPLDLLISLLLALSIAFSRPAPWPTPEPVDGAARQ